MELGFCLAAAERERLAQNPPSDEAGFVHAVFVAEGLHPDTADRQLVGQVRDLVAHACTRDEHPHEVFFVLGDFDGDLWSLSRVHHVWLVASAHNRSLAKDVWARESKDHGETAGVMSGVTTFDGSVDAVADFYALLGTIDQHHDEHSASEAWSSIHVRGLPLADVDATRIDGELEGRCVKLVCETGGFAIVRQRQ